jgi:hypothetical protein
MLTSREIGLPLQAPRRGTKSISCSDNKAYHTPSAARFPYIVRSLSTMELGLPPIVDALGTVSLFHLEDVLEATRGSWVLSLPTAANESLLARPKADRQGSAMPGQMQAWQVREDPPAAVSRARSAPHSYPSISRLHAEFPNPASPSPSILALAVVLWPRPRPAQRAIARANRIRFRTRLEMHDT